MLMGKWVKFHGWLVGVVHAAVAMCAMIMCN